MLNSLRKYLTWLCTITTGCILILVVAGSLLFRMEGTKRGQLEQFQNIWNNVSSRMRFGTTISHSWLAQTETAGHLILRIKENGILSLYTGSWMPRTGRQILIDRVKQMAAEQGVYTAAAPVSSFMNATSLITLTGDEGEEYYAMVLAISTGNGVKSLYLISYIPPVTQVLRETILYLGLTYVFGITGLFLISWKFVGWSLRSVEESRQKQAELIASASHELRSPLAVLRSGIAAIKVKPEESEALLRTTDAECTRMSWLINDILLLASTDAQTWSIHMEETDLDTLLIDTHEAFLPTCREKNMKLQLWLPDGTLPAIRVDKERLKQVLFIPLDNALSYTPSERSITLKAEVSSQGEPTRHHPRQIHIQVTNQGLDIPDGVKAHIFGRFYRVDSSRSKKEHFGLGSSIVRELVFLHGGTIRVEDNPGGGNRLVTTLSI